MHVHVHVHVHVYVYQIASQLTPYYHAVKAADKIGLLQRTFEDGSFGADTTMVDGVNVSRDLLDSVSEMLFLHKAFLYRPGGLDTLSVLDVGGGYGRLTKRWRDAWPKGKYHVTDGMAISTYLAKSTWATTITAGPLCHSRRGTASLTVNL